MAPEYPFEDGGPAFPGKQEIRGPYGSKWEELVLGMSLRDWFAGQALAGLLANSEAYNHVPTKDAEDAYKYADAMLKARENG